MDYAPPKYGFGKNGSRVIYYTHLIIWPVCGYRICKAPINYVRSFHTTPSFIFSRLLLHE